MLQLDISHMKIKSYASLKTKLQKIKKMELPSFDSYREDIDKLKKSMKRYKKYNNLIVIGNGGSVTSFQAYHHALVPMGSKKKTFILTTMEPDLINQIKECFPKRKTLVMPVSKSGTTVGVIESMLALSDYPLLPVTTPGTGALSIIAEKNKQEMIPHPEVGGRYSGVTASAYAPALFFDIDVENIDNGARSMYATCNPQVTIDKNPALQLAASLFLLDQKGYTEVFCPIYSWKLAGFQELVMQLIHETVGKKKKGQTIYCAEAPESQHHTNQRFFGGRQNVAGLFITVENQDDKTAKVKVPKPIQRIKEKEGTLKDIDGVPYEKALEYEFRGTWEDALNNKIPIANISLDKVSAYSVGELLAFWHYVAVYSAALRDLNPFDQPQVEASKNISFRLRKEHKQ